MRNFDELSNLTILSSRLKAEGTSRAERGNPRLYTYSQANIKPICRTAEEAWG